MNNIKEIITQALISGSKTSSKRLNGTVGFLLMQVIIIILSLTDVIYDGILSETIADIIKVDIYISAALLGLGLVEKSKLMK